MLPGGGRQATDSMYQNIEKTVGSRRRDCTRRACRSMVQLKSARIPLCFDIHFERNRHLNEGRLVVVLCSRCRVLCYVTAVVSFSSTSQCIL